MCFRAVTCTILGVLLEGWLAGWLALPRLPVLQPKQIHSSLPALSRRNVACINRPREFCTNYVSMKADIKH
ncbi:hypothetical protein BO86DRAFT_393520 [Aspergillus japonicus CBS 114.51]|uniref:Uncharacterized protein n=1 Tax=Aspergillus japonicus CBS 114.51 TaxID=1448312 RepID=A0A8T8WKW9_ASPJA|nr:hypothetical protein BO86DRAFT_393520 [Aspergillus japonicus CBS 114.51]RAH76312.1 hypothetical protein BO86DRAFT_393520 [Aspergillus japonicus CBS 114.51]